MKYNTKSDAIKDGEPVAVRVNDTWLTRRGKVLVFPAKRTHGGYFKQPDGGSWAPELCFPADDIPPDLEIENL